MILPMPMTTSRSQLGGSAPRAPGRHGCEALGTAALLALVATAAQEEWADGFAPPHDWQQSLAPRSGFRIGLVYTVHTAMGEGITSMGEEIAFDAGHREAAPNRATSR